MNKKNFTYKSAGVDIKRADDFLKEMGMVKDKHQLSAFASLFPLRKIKTMYKNPCLVASCDGVGTKLKLAQEVGIHHTVGIDLVAMNVNDIVCLGAIPLFFLDYIACGRIKKDILSAVMKGIKRGLKEAQCLLRGGETAEMPGVYEDNEYDLAGFCVGVVEENKVINGKDIKEGDIVIGLKSNGLHSNGFSLVRNILSLKERKKYHKELLKPTRIYVKVIKSLIEEGRTRRYIKGIAHITGGAFYKKATKIIPQGLGMVIRKESWHIPKIFKLIQEKGNIKEREMFTVFNMGIGMIIVVAKDELNYIERRLSSLTPYYIIGEIVKEKKKKVQII